MKDTYIRKVLRMLDIPKNKKQQIARDLREIFCSSYERGESYEQIVERLGPPETFAKDIAAELDVPYGKNNTGCVILSLLTMFLGTVSLAVYIVAAFLTRSRDYSFGTVGGFDGPTQIYVTSSTNFDWSVLLLVFGIFSLVISVFFFIRHIKRR